MPLIMTTGVTLKYYGLFRLHNYSPISPPPTGVKNPYTALGLDWSAVIRMRMISAIPMHLCTMALILAINIDIFLSIL